MSSYCIEALGEADYEALVDLWEDAGLTHRPEGRDSREAILAQMSIPYCRFFGVRANGEDVAGEADGEDFAGQAAHGERARRNRVVPGKRLLGSAIANHEGRKGWINRLAVRPSVQRAGIARALVAACEGWLFAEGILIVAALVEGDNRSSQALFSACGYERDDTLVYFRKLARQDV